jgi:hypothetical protein
MSGEAKAIQPGDVTLLVAERLNAGDAASVAAYTNQGPCWHTRPTSR